MFKIIKLLFLILVFEKTNAIHHHQRISENLLIASADFITALIVAIFVKKGDQ